MDRTLFADTTRFPHETIDGETVLVDSQLGHLYLFTGLGPWLWHRMTLGGTVEEVVAEMAARFGADAADPVRRFIEALEEAELLRAGDGRPGGSGKDASMPCPDAFTVPAMERYEDIADIIAMDPVHDIDTTKGWPHRKTESE